MEVALKFKVFLVSVLFVCNLLPAFSFAQNKVVVIPLLEEPTGPPAPVPKTGQTQSRDTRDDGQLQLGVEWPNPRFINHGNGVVTDKLTALTWLKNGRCTEFYFGDPWGGGRPWENALYACNGLASPYCDLTDGSLAGDWRLPNLKELESLVDLGYVEPALSPSCPMATFMYHNNYWSSNSHMGFPDTLALAVDFRYGFSGSHNKNSLWYMLCVRGGQ